MIRKSLIKNSDWKAICCMLHTNWYIDVMIRLPCHLQTACGYLHVRVARPSRLPGGLCAGERSTKECQWRHGNAAVEHCAARPLGAPWKHRWRPAEISRYRCFQYYFSRDISAEHDDLSNLVSGNIHMLSDFVFLADLPPEVYRNEWGVGPPGTVWGTNHPQPFEVTSPHAIKHSHAKAIDVDSWGCLFRKNHWSGCLLGGDDGV